MVAAAAAAAPSAAAAAADKGALLRFSAATGHADAAWCGSHNCGLHSSQPRRPGASPPSADQTGPHARGDAWSGYQGMSETFQLPDGGTCMCSRGRRARHERSKCRLRRGAGRIVAQLVPHGRQRWSTAAWCTPWPTAGPPQRPENAPTLPQQQCPSLQKGTPTGVLGHTAFPSQVPGTACDCTTPPHETLLTRVQPALRDARRPEAPERIHASAPRRAQQNSGQ